MSRWLYAVGAIVAVGAVVLLIRLDDDSPRAASWDLVERPKPGDTSFDISVSTDECRPDEAFVDRLEVEQSKRVIAVTAYVVVEGGTADDCLSTLPTTVELQDPVGDREIVNGK